MANAQEIYPVQLDSILMADNVDNAQPIVLNASLIPSAIDAWMDLNFNPPNFSAWKHPTAQKSVETEEDSRSIVMMVTLKTVMGAMKIVRWKMAIPVKEVQA